MNTEAELLLRLIRLFPVKILKENFDIPSNGDALFNDILREELPQNINAFAYTNINSTKQHVYIYHFTHLYNLATFNPASFPYTVINRSMNGSQLQITISPVVEFSVTVNNPFEEIILNFHQPYILTIERDKLIIQATIMEKNMSSYFDPTRKVLNVEKNNDERLAIENILSFFLRNLPIPCDLNRGIKQLWANDVIDSRYIKWKRNRSTATESMDENYTLKEQYPDDYRRIISDPLNRTIFRYLPEDEGFPDHFTVDPSRGEISVPIYPKNQNQIPNVINQILSNN